MNRNETRKVDLGDIWAGIPEKELCTKIAEAYNLTYGAGFDPKGVGKMKKALEYFLEVKEWTPKEINNAESLVQEALTAIKPEPSEKPEDNPNRSNMRHGNNH